MNNRREFLAAGGALAALSVLPKANADQPHGSKTVYLHGMVWNQELAAPMNDWLIRLDAKADIPLGNAAPPAVSGFATLGDDFHDQVGSHVQFQTASLDGDQLTISGAITESKNACLAGLPVLIEGS